MKLVADRIRETCKAVLLPIGSSSRFVATTPRNWPSNVAGLVPADLNRGAGDMLWTIFVVLLVLWLLGVVSSYTMGGFIHILLVLAVIALLFQLISGRRPVV